MKGIAILGATGSVGESTLDVVARHPARFRVVALGAQRNAARLAEQGGGVALCRTAQGLRLFGGRERGPV